MLKRLLVLGDDKKLLKAAEKAAAKRPGLRITAPADENSAVQALGVIASSAEHLPAAFQALDGAIREHEALFVLLSEAIDAREGHMRGSCARLCDHAVRLGKALGLPEEKIQALERGALLHDVGKLLISNDVLMKKSLLTYDEWLELHAHTTKGKELLEGLGFEQDVLDIVQFHHEAFDGDGYPNHLEREKIPHLARIMKICDVFTAMTSPRHYRPGIPTIEEALEHLAAERGKHFDPVIIDVFLEQNIGQPWSAA
jgi:putative nucleotidyltransferase with HDIG domain